MSIINNLLDYQNRCFRRGEYLNCLDRMSALDNQAIERTPHLISIVVCTYNRANLLAGALQTLCKQTLAPSEYEIIVVDNNSSDDTRVKVEEFSQRYPNLRYAFERQQGLSHARNSGWRKARGEYVAYTDDDCKLPQQWLTKAKAIIEELSPAVFGGPYYAYYNSSKPQWWKDSYRSSIITNTARELTQGEYLSGGNIFFRRELLESMGGFDSSLGMSGDTIAAGEETSLLNKILKTNQNHLIYYDPQLFVYHLVHAEKMKLKWLARNYFYRGRSVYRVNQNNNLTVSKRHQLVLLIFGFLTLLKFFEDVLIGLLLRDQEQYPYVQNYLYEHAFKYLGKIGKIYEEYQHISQIQRVKEF